MARSTSDDEADLHLPEGVQRQAVAAEVRRSAIVAGGVGPVRANKIADDVARHLVGALRQRGLKLTVSWVSPEARDALERANGPIGGAPLPPPDPDPWP